jgi:hypothetical protein
MEPLQDKKGIAVECTTREMKQKEYAPLIFYTNEGT